MLEQAGLSRKYWEYAAEYVAYIKNRVIHSGIRKTPYETLTGKQPTLKHAKVFGCSAFVYNHSPKTKVHGRASPAIFLVCNDHGVFTVERMTDGKIINSVHVTFDEESFPALDKSDSSSSDNDSDKIYHESETSDTHSTEEDSEPFQNVYSESISSEGSSVEDSNTTLQDDGNTSDDETDQQNINVVHVEITDQPAESSDRPRRNTRAPQYLTYEGVKKACSVISFLITTSDEPSVNEAMNATFQEAKLWKEAIEAELSTLSQKETWKPVGKIPQMKGRYGLKADPITHVDILPSFVKLKIKRDEEGYPVKFKARVVAGENFQIFGKDFDSVYAPVIDFSIVLLMLCIAISLGWFTKHTDVKAAFLNGDIDRETYISHPVNLPPELMKDKYYILYKALYGLKQAPLQWFLKLRNSFCNDMKYVQLNSDGAVFFKAAKSNSDYLVIALVYVDDIIFLSPSQEKLDQELHTFLNLFEGSDLGEVKWYLGIQVETENGYKKLTQKSYILQLLQSYQLQNVCTYDTPMTTNILNDIKVHEKDEVIDNKEYRSMIGSLMFLANRTRPDISTYVNILAKYVSKPNAFLKKCATRVFGYLKSTLEYGLVQNKSETISLEVYCDSDFAGDQIDRKSRTGWAVVLNGSAISWASHKQSTVALSSSEAEYIAMSEA